MNKEIVEKILTYTDVSFELVYNNKIKEFSIASNFTDIIKSLDVQYSSFSPEVYNNFLKELQKCYQDGKSNI